MPKKHIELSRGDILGKRVAGVYRTDWRRYKDIICCQGYVELDNGLAFEMIGTPSDVNSIHAVELERNALISVVFPANQTCIGDTITRLIRYTGPCVAAVLSTNWVLAMEDVYLRSLGPCLLQCDSYVLTDVQDFWDKSPIALSQGDEEERH